MWFYEHVPKVSLYPLYLILWTCTPNYPCILCIWFYEHVPEVSLYPLYVILWACTPKYPCILCIWFYEHVHRSIPVSSVSGSMSIDHVSLSIPVSSVSGSMSMYSEVSLYPLYLILWACTPKYPCILCI